MDPDRYRVVAAHARAEPPRTKGSRFVADVFSAGSEAQAAAHLEAVRKREHAATHWCWAWRLGPAGARARAADAGEPAGTAGPPILREIEARGLTDTLVVVTRYYGGTKLGTGGLARAYAEAAAAGLDAAPVEARVVRSELRLRFGFADTAAAMRTLQRFDTEFGTPAYGPTGAEVVVRVARSQTAALAKAFIEATGGRGDVSGLPGASMDSA